MRRFSTAIYLATALSSAALAALPPLVHGPSDDATGWRSEGAVHHADGGGARERDSAWLDTGVELVPLAASGMAR